ncbi:phage tail assembly protein [Pseudomonas citronellolis]|uniref:phage tail assembly protein n=1 Tax=Pseudomonas citronellolis TaxID=53408 RepID=UPI0023E46869|nr:phage tail assembly protein [Pseudomonas citronellolis]MDF3932305.1 phage tail assembly protein [Pseudomonas citronellolis]
MHDSAQLPAWLSLDEDAAVVTLSRPTPCNGVNVDALTLRAPTVRDIRLASKVASDDEERELQLFASLAQVSRQDLEGLKLSDYQRLQQAYFRLVREDGPELLADAPAGAASGG